MLVSKAVSDVTAAAARTAGEREITDMLRAVALRADLGNLRGQSVSFGRYRLFPTAREFEKDGVALPLGSRALDILIVLVERAGEVVGHKELVKRVWRDLVVDSSNLRVHITGLRKALGDGEGHIRYIVNVPGQGYSFVAPIRRTDIASRPEPERTSKSPAFLQRLALPTLLKRMVGREEVIRTIGANLLSDRFVTIVGSGGMGKTTAAVAVAHAMVERFDQAVCFVDMTAITRPVLVAATVASALGLKVETEDALFSVVECLRHLRLLLVLDNCEHVIETASALAERIFSEAPGVHILATSREALRVEGEHAYWLPALDSPPAELTVDATKAAAFSAVNLFVERATAGGSRFTLSDANATVVAGICNRLDGIALAIELAAGHVGAYGLEGTARLLDDRLGLHWHGKRTATPRHRTLHAMLDWSYNLLDEGERQLLAMLSTFVGTFTAKAAQEVGSLPGTQQVKVEVALDSLVMRSLVSTTSADDGCIRYRLLETTRAFALEKLGDSGEASAAARRHALYFRHLMELVAAEYYDPYHDNRALTLREHLGNVRTALEWCFGGSQFGTDDATSAPPYPSPGVDAARDSRLAIGVDLAAASIPLFLELSLMAECHRWCALALMSLDDATRGGKLEMALLEGCATSSTWTRGKCDDVRAAITRALDIARNLGETAHHLRLLSGMHVLLVRFGDFRASQVVAEELEVAARVAGNGLYQVIADWALGSSRYFLGDQEAAQRFYDKGFSCAGPGTVNSFGLDCRVRALVVCARIAWLRGRSDQAAVLARDVVMRTKLSNNPLNVCFALLFTAPIFIWRGDWSGAVATLDELTANANWYALQSFHAIALALQGELLTCLGRAEEGIALLLPALAAMRGDSQGVARTFAACALADALAKMRRSDEAVRAIDEALAQAQFGGEALDLPELLRVKGRILLTMPDRDESESEACFTASLAYARQQSALSWELRTAISLGELRISQGRCDEARELVSSVYGRFTEGFESGDLQAARQLLAVTERA